MRNRNCFSIFTGTGTVHKSGACIPCFADILSAPSEAEKPKIGVCFCRSRPVRDRFILYAGKYGTEHDICIKRRHHRCMCPVLCSRYGRILFKNEKSGLWFYIGFVIAVTRRIYFYGILFLIPVLLIQHASWNVALFRDTEIAANFLILGFSGKLKTELQ